MKKNDVVVMERPQLATIKTPKGTPTWTPVSHTDVLNLFEKEVKARGFRIINERHQVARAGNRYFGVLYLERPKKEQAKSARDFDLLLGMRNAHDRSIAVGGVAGSHVIVCANMCFSGEEKFTQRHTRFVENYLPHQVQSIVGKLMKRYEIQDARIDAYKTIEITDTRANDFIIEALDRGAICGSDIPEILTEWRTPKHPEFSDGKTVWRLFNSFTENFKQVSIFDLPRRSDILHMLADKAAKFEVPTLEEAAKN